MNNNKQLPKDWNWAKLGDTLDIQGGSQPPKSNFIYEPKEGYIQLLQIRDFGLRGVPTYVPLNKVTKFCKKDDIMIARYGASLGRIITGLEGAYNVALAKVIDEKKLFEKRFIFYLLKTNIFQTPLKLLSRSAQNGFSKSELAHIELPLPPKPIQQKIVSKIEELFSELDKGIEELKKTQQQLKVYRRTILMNGVTGKLTAQWRNENPNEDSSEKVFLEIQDKISKSFSEACDEAIAKGKRKPKDQRKNKKTFNVEDNLPELPYSWNYYRLEDISFLVTDGTHFTPKYQKEGVKFLSVKNVRPFYFKEEDVKYISQEEHNILIQRCHPQKGDILYTKVGATFGYAAKVNMNYVFSIFVSLCLIKPVYECFYSDFLEILMNSELVFQQARKRVSGSGVPDLHLIEIRDFKIPLMSINEQKQIVQEVESRLSVCDKIEGTINNSLQQSEALRQSILKKAFEGNLV